jgi:hypothetical protein
VVKCLGTTVVGMLMLEERDDVVVVVLIASVDRD